MLESRLVIQTVKTGRVGLKEVRRVGRHGLKVKRPGVTIGRQVIRVGRQEGKVWKQIRRVQRL